MSVDHHYHRHFLFYGKTAFRVGNQSSYPLVLPALSAADSPPGSRISSAGGQFCSRM